ncbi:MAG: site-2 protease family protein [Planctomycetota bacterium]|jgi:Zn-dependent protease
MFENFDIALAAVWYIILLIALVFHEAAHSFAALKLGDSTACHGGQVTLDPIPHIRREPFGTVIVPIISYFLAGWMIGWASAPYDPYWAQRYPKKAALMALAGPAANLALVVAAALIIRAGMLLGFFHAPDEIDFTTVTAATGGGFANPAAVVVSILFSLNLFLMVFNLIPLPPLDGSNVLLGLLSHEAAERYSMVMAAPQYRIIGLIVAWKIFGYVLGPVHLLAINLLYPEVGYA